MPSCLFPAIGISCRMLSLLSCWTPQTYNPKPAFTPPYDHFTLIKWVLCTLIFTSGHNLKKEINNYIFLWLLCVPISSCWLLKAVEEKNTYQIPMQYMLHVKHPSTLKRPPSAHPSYLFRILCLLNSNTTHLSLSLSLYLSLSPLSPRWTWGWNYHFAPTHHLYTESLLGWFIVFDRH